MMVEGLSKQMTSEEAKQKIEDIRSKVRDLSGRLINIGKPAEAVQMLEKFSSKVPGDPDICSMTAVAYIMTGNIDKAEEAIYRGLAGDTVQFDLLYNLAYIYEMKNELLKAADLYMKAASGTDDVTKKNLVKEALDRIKASDSSIVFREKEKIVFFAKGDNCNLIDNVVKALSNEYWTRKISVTDCKQIEEGMEWADICWFESCDKLLVYGCRLPLARLKKIICRLHGYELYTDYPGYVDWRNVDKLVLAARHIENTLKNDWPDISDKVGTTVIGNGVDVEKFAFKEQNKGFNIATIGQQATSIKRLLRDLSLKNKAYTDFSPYTSGYIDRFDFSDTTVAIGKKERISTNYQSISFILKNSREKRLVITDIMYDKQSNCVILPEYIRISKNRDRIMDYCRQIISDPSIKFNEHGIAGFVYDDRLAEDIRGNYSAYIWERGIPATEFMPDAVFSKIIRRYRFVMDFISENCSMLEAASGFGYGAAYLAGRQKGIRITAIDIAEENIRFGKSSYDFENIEWLQGDVTKLPLASGGYDIYVSFETLEHLPVDSVGSYFTEALRVLKNGGKMILSTPNKKARAGINNPFHVKEYTFSELDNILRKYFDSVDYYSGQHEIKPGADETAKGFIAVCHKA